MKQTNFLILRKPSFWKHVKAIKIQIIKNFFNSFSVLVLSFFVFTSQAKGLINICEFNSLPAQITKIGEDSMLKRDDVQLASLFKISLIDVSPDVLFPDNYRDSHHIERDRILNYNDADKYGINIFEKFDNYCAPKDILPNYLSSRLFIMHFENNDELLSQDLFLSMSKSEYAAINSNLLYSNEPNIGATLATTGRLISVVGLIGSIAKIAMGEPAGVWALVMVSGFGIRFISIAFN